MVHSSCSGTRAHGRKQHENMPCFFSLPHRALSPQHQRGGNEHISGIRARPRATRGALERESVRVARLPRCHRPQTRSKRMMTRNLRLAGAGQGAQRAHGEQQIDGNATAHAGASWRVRSAHAMSVHLLGSGAATSAFRIEEADAASTGPSRGTSDVGWRC